MSKTTTLANGKVTLTDRILVELVEPEDFPASIVITWPQAPSAVDPRKFGATANAVIVNARLSRPLVLKQSGQIEKSLRFAPTTIMASPRAG